MKKQLIVLFLTFLIILFSCETDNKNENNDDNTGKLKGTIGLYEGNCMPGPGIPPCQPSPISTTVAITALSDNFNLNLLIDSVVASADGKFEISLPEGTYSLFIRDGSDFICNLWTCPDNCYCAPFTIKKDSTTNINANIDHAVW